MFGGRRKKPALGSRTLEARRTAAATLLAVSAWCCAAERYVIELDRCLGLPQQARLRALAFLSAKL